MRRNEESIPHPGLREIKRADGTPLFPNATISPANLIGMQAIAAQVVIRELGAQLGGPSSNTTVTVDLNNEYTGPTKGLFGRVEKPGRLQQSTRVSFTSEADPEQHHIEVRTPDGRFRVSSRDQEVARDGMVAGTRWAVGSQEARYAAEAEHNSEVLKRLAEQSRSKGARKREST